MLLKLRAKDLNVREEPCTTPPGVPSPFPSVRATMRVLVPVSPEKSKSHGPVVQAHWQNAVLMPSNASFNERGKCELIAQFKETFLALFTTRRIDCESTCIPHQLTLGTHLSAEVLMPNAKGGKR